MSAAVSNRCRVKKTMKKSAPSSTPQGLSLLPEAVYTARREYETSPPGDDSRSTGPLRRLWRPLCARNAHACFVGIGAGIRSRAEGSRLPTTTRLLPQGIRRASDAALFRGTADQTSARCQDLFEAGGSLSHRCA